jgi:hypothetical protein
MGRKAKHLAVMIAGSTVGICCSILGPDWVDVRTLLSGIGVGIAVGAFIVSIWVDD